MNRRFPQARLQRGFLERRKRRVQASWFLRRFREAALTVARGSFSSGKFLASPQFARLAQQFYLALIGFVPRWGPSLSLAWFPSTRHPQDQYIQRLVLGILCCPLSCRANGQFSFPTCVAP